MKKHHYVIIFLSFLTLAAVYGFRQIATEGRIEEYALVDVKETGLGTDIFLTVGDSATQHIQIKKKLKDDYNHAHAFAQLKKLNQQGFEIVNEVTSFDPGGGGGTFYGIITHSYFLRKKLPN
jgi:hypothetical protein